VPTRAQARVHHDRGRRGGAGGTDSPLGEVQLGVQDEYPRVEGHSPGNVREHAAPTWLEDGEGGPAQWRSEAVAVLRGMACGSDVPRVSRRNRR
jgi:hypothetical protein